MERMTGIEPASLVWKTKALPLSYIREVSREKLGNPTILWDKITKLSARCRANLRDVAQLGRAPVLGTGGCRFKSCHPDHCCLSDSNKTQLAMRRGPFSGEGS